MIGYRGYPMGGRPPQVCGKREEYRENQISEKICNVVEKNGTWKEEEKDS